ncbi:hypothetical protein H8K47_18140, partial [Undibacterium sp. CY7W]|nr:hypothetical protein [Undibacterium rugosum]
GGAALVKVGFSGFWLVTAEMVFCGCTCGWTCTSGGGMNGGGGASSFGGGGGGVSGGGGGGLTSSTIFVSRGF